MQSLLLKLRQNIKQWYNLIMEIKIDKKFVKLGRSWGVIVPPWILSSLNINPQKDNVTLSVKNNKIVIEKQ